MVATTSTALTVACRGDCLMSEHDSIQFYFLHNHFLPKKLKQEPCIKSVIVPEFYPDLNNTYLGEPCFFNSVEAYIQYVISRGYYECDTVFAVENNRIIASWHIHEQLTSYKKLGVKIIQLYCGADNDFFTRRDGLTHNGKRLLSEICDIGLILDLSHIPEQYVLHVANTYEGDMIISHCACSDLYSSKRPRSNSLTQDTICRLAERVKLFGVSFLNDIVASQESEESQEQIFSDIINQTVLFINIAGACRTAFAPDYIDTDYFSRRFNTKLAFPEKLLSVDGLLSLTDRLYQVTSADNVKKILSKNVLSLFS